MYILLEVGEQLKTGDEIWTGSQWRTITKAENLKVNDQSAPIRRKLEFRPGTITPMQPFQEPVSLRDYFAGKAMQAIIACPEYAKMNGMEGVVVTAYEYAETMLKARETIYR